MFIKRMFHIGRGVARKGTSFMDRHVKDPWVKMAHESGYRARSAFKLKEIDQAFRLFKPGMTVVECGASPGAWTQIAADGVNASGFYNGSKPAGILVGCDLLSMEPVDGAKFVQGDFTDEIVKGKIKELCQGNELDVVLSDMAPNATGMGDLSHQAIVNLAYTVVKFSLEHSKVGGKLVIKLWDGGSKDRLFKDLERFYGKVKNVKPAASRTESAEMFLVATDFKGVVKKS